jgi:hypothetical protein
MCITLYNSKLYSKKVLLIVYNFTIMYTVVYNVIQLIKVLRCIPCTHCASTPLAQCVMVSSIESCSEKVYARMVKKYRNSLGAITFFHQTQAAPLGDRYLRIVYIFSSLTTFNINTYRSVSMFMFGYGSVYLCYSII